MRRRNRGVVRPLWALEAEALALPAGGHSESDPDALKA